jgi:hypothetical protein
MKYKSLTALSAVVVCAMIPTPGHAQVTTSTRTSVGVGSTRGSTLGFIGIANVKCNCTFMTDDDGSRTFTFRSNPVVLGIYEGSPADGALERGDTITAIDGYALMTAEGARRFANIQPGQRLTLNVSRSSRRMTLLLKASNVGSGDVRAFGTRAPVVSSGSWSYDFPGTPPPPEPAIPAEPAIPPMTPRPATAPMPGAVVWGVRPPRSIAGVVAPATPATPAVSGVYVYGPTPPTPPVAAIAPVPAMAPVPPMPPSPTGWFGFSIKCSECGWSQQRDDDSPVWESSSPPELSMISRDGPAARAGLLAGDRITHVNGVSILTNAGARAFGRVRPGQTVRLTVLRDGKSLTRELTLATRPELRAAIAASGPTPRPSALRRELRYTGQLDNVSVEVWSAAGPTVDRNGDTITITVGTSVIRLKAR